MKTIQIALGQIERVSEARGIKMNKKQQRFEFITDQSPVLNFILEIRNGLRYGPTPALITIVQLFWKCAVTIYAFPFRKDKTMICAIKHTHTHKQSRAFHILHNTCYLNQINILVSKIQIKRRERKGFD